MYDSCNVYQSTAHNNMKSAQQILIYLYLYNTVLLLKF
jgi:hypothetical protein